MLPKGLVVCRFCGHIRGRTAGGAESSCLCDGITCRYCGAGRVHRPISDHYEPDDGEFWHTPYFGAGIPCVHCRRLGRRVDPDAISWPGPLREDPETRALLDTLRGAAAALGPRQPAQLAREDAPGLVAFHGDASAWQSIGLERPRDGRPLVLLRIGCRAVAGWERTRLGRAYWASGAVDLARAEAELCVRWAPAIRNPDLTRLG